MTSIRRLPTSAERGSRQSQFRPGHAGGRVASAQPIRRRGGTLAGPAIGAAGAPSLALRYPHIILPGAATYSSFSGTGGAKFYWTPPADGFPVTVVGGVPFGGDSWGAYHIATTASPTMTAGPPLAPGSTYSRAIAGPTFQTLKVYSGDYWPRWGETTTLGISVHYGVSTTASLPAGTELNLHFGSQWYSDAGHPLSYDLYRPASGGWGIYVTVGYHGGGPGGVYDFGVTIPGSAGFPTGSLTSGTAHHMALTLDCAAAALTVEADGATYTLTDSRLWPTSADFSHQIAPPWVHTLDSSEIDVTLDTPYRSTTVYFDQLRIDCDVPYYPAS